MTQKQRFSKPIKRQTLAEQVAKTIEESILAGEWKSGEPLPTEPELSDQFNVSRAVVRDGTRMLAAKGLVDVQHGRGVFVTESQTEAFGEALLLALRRAGATVWDVEHFEQIVYPEIFALAAEKATDDEIKRLRQLLDDHTRILQKNLSQLASEEILPSGATEPILVSYRTLITQIFAMTHNQVFELLALPLVRLRSLRNWQENDLTEGEFMELESGYFQAVLEAIASRNPDQVRKTMYRLMKLPPEAEKAMRSTPIGEVPLIPTAFQNRSADRS